MELFIQPLNIFFNKKNIMKENELTEIIIGICIKIHKLLGPGLFESVYEEIIAYELFTQGIPYERQKAIGVKYENIELNLGFRADFIVDDKVIIELKSIENIAPVHKKQVITYLRLSDKKLGLLINFNVNLLKEGIFRIVNNL